MDHRHYWDTRLRRNFDLAGVGYLALGQSYNRWLYSAKVRALNKAIRKCGISVPGSSVLDVGCGTGFWVRHFERLRARQVVGLDSSQKSVEVLRRLHPQHRFVLADVSSNDLGLSREFDIISAFEVLWYLPEEAFSYAFANLAKAARPGAYLLVTDYLSTLRPGNSAPFYSSMYPRDLQSYATECARSGFKILGTFPLFCLMNAPTDPESIVNARRRAFVNASWHRISRLLPRFPWLGHPLGAVLYLLDGMVLDHSTCAPSTKLLVCRFDGGEE